MRLADIGLVEMAPNRYTRVAPIDLRAIDEAISTAGILHEYAARTGVPELTAPAVARLEKLAKDAKKYAKSADLSALGGALNAFFREFEVATDNRVLLAVSEGLSPQLLRYVTAWQQPFGSPDLAAQLAAIAAAAKERDAEKAAGLIHELYEPARQQFLKEFRRSDAEIDASPII